MSSNTTTQWIDEMIIELRLRQVSGTAIGDAVAAVRSHCAESGETPQQAFGDPREYARSLDFAEHDLVHTDAVEWTRTLAPVVLGVLAVMLVGPVVTALYERTALAVTWGQISATVVLALFVLLIMRMLRAVLQSRLNTALMFGGASAALAALVILWDTPAFHLPAWLGAVVVVLLLGASVLSQWASLNRDDDPIVDPLEGSRGNPILHGVAIWVFPLVAAALALLTLIPLWLS